MTSRPLALALHGGSGTINRSTLTAEQERAYLDALAGAREIGWKILTSGGSALDASEQASRFLEDCPLFNAGRGAVFTADASHELDAAVMCGRECRAGAVAGVRTVRNPVALARKVMEDGRFVMIAGPGCEDFADSTDLERVESSWFDTDLRRNQLIQAQEDGAVVMDHDTSAGRKFGTIGVVALDRRGDLAACTSTGGLTNKRFGRIGDSPVIGAGTYADNRTCAISCTGYGEEFIRAVVAYDVAARMSYLREDLYMASNYVVRVKLLEIGGSGGLVAVDARGNVALPFNTDGMYRAWINTAGNEGVAIF